MRTIRRTASRALAVVAVALGLLAGAAAAFALPASGALAATLLVAVLAVVVVSVAGALPSDAAVERGLARTRVALERLVPRGAQSDPDARGHARPRAPGALLPAV